MIDEADEAMPGMMANSPKRNKREAGEALSSPARKKRKPGPLSPHISLSNRPSTPTLSDISDSEMSDTESVCSNGDDDELISIAKNHQTTPKVRQLLGV